MIPITKNSKRPASIEISKIAANAQPFTTDLLASWSAKAATIKTSANNLLWNSTSGLYHDNETTTLQPQDGNCWAVVSNLTLSPSQAASISSGLASRWTAYGAPAVEAANAVSPFISGFELQMHLLAGNASAALGLLRLEWGFMMDDPRMTNSTFIEGYSDDGVLHYAPYTNGEYSHPNPRWLVDSNLGADDGFC